MMQPVDTGSVQGALTLLYAAACLLGLVTLLMPMDPEIDIPGTVRGVARGGRGGRGAAPRRLVAAKTGLAFTGRGVARARDGAPPRPEARSCRPTDKGRDR
jgi:hypothetical protein